MCVCVCVFTSIHVCPTVVLMAVLLCAADWHHQAQSPPVLHVIP